MPSTHDTAKIAYDATVKGAMEFFAKDLFTSQMTSEKREKILSTLKHITGIRKKISPHQEKAKAAITKAHKTDAVVIASSTGGPKALCQLFSGLAKNFPVPIILVQHNTSGFDKGFVQWLDGYTELNVLLAEEGMMPAAGNIYVAPTDRHLLIGSDGFSLDDGEPINSQKPAADLLFKSAAEFYGKALISVVLTGMGSDGAEGTRLVKQAGGITIAQDEASSLIFGMPQAAIETGCVDMVINLYNITTELISLTKRMV